MEKIFLKNFARKSSVEINTSLSLSLSLSLPLFSLFLAISLSRYHVVYDLRQHEAIRDLFTRKIDLFLCSLKDSISGETANSQIESVARYSGKIYSTEIFDKN